MGENPTSKNALKMGTLCFVIFTLMISSWIEVSAVFQSARFNGLTQFSHATKADGENWLEGWKYRRKITIDSTKVDSDLTDFPVLIHLSSSSGISDVNVTYVFAEVGSNYNALAFTTSGLTRLYYEVEYWNATNQEAYVWVKVPTVSSASNTVIYIYYDSAKDGSEYHVPEQVWESSAVMVQHFEEATGNVASDSTTNNNDGTIYGDASWADAKIGKALSFDDVNDRVAIPTSDSVNLTEEVTVVAWVYKTEFKANYEEIVNMQRAYQCYLENTTHKIGFAYYDGTAWRVTVTNTALQTGEWVFLTWTQKASDSNTLVTIYRNGVVDRQSTLTGRPVSATAAYLYVGDGSYPFRGVIDEVRIYSQSKSAAWVKANYYSGVDSLVSYAPFIETSDTGWLSGWNYRKSLIVSTGIHIITAHYGSGNDVLGHTYLDGGCQADFGDIRFTSSDGETLIDEVTVRRKVDKDCAEFKVNVLESLIYIYYGNSLASALYENEVLTSGSLGDTEELTQSYVTSGEGEISGIARKSPVTGFATSLEAIISSDVGSMGQMALLLMNCCIESTDYPKEVYGRRIVALTETKNIPASGKHREVFKFEKPVPIFKDTVYGIALWAGAGTKVWREPNAGEGSFSLAGGFSGDMVLHTGPLGNYAYGRFMNYEQVDEDEQNVLFRDNADYTQSRSMWHQHWEELGTIDAQPGLGIGGSYAFNSTVTASSGEGWGELAFKGEIKDGNKRFWSGVVRLSALPDLYHHSDLLAVLRCDPWRSLNGLGVDRTEAGVQWRLSMRSKTGAWAHLLFGEVEADTDYLLILSYETDGVNAKSEVWVTKLSEPELLEEALPSATLTVANDAFGDLFFIGVADYPLGNVSAISAFFDEMTLTEDFPATFGAWGVRECFPHVYLALTVEPNQVNYGMGQSLAFTVNVFNHHNPALETTLTFTVKGPSGYYFFDFDRITVAADSVGEYVFVWQMPDDAGTYAVEVSVIPPRLTAYDAVWLKVT